MKPRWIHTTLLLTHLLAIALTLAGSAAAAPPDGGGDFITIQGNQFMLNGQPYKAIGVTNYPFLDGNYAYTERSLRRAKAAGITLIRGCEFFTATASPWNSEANWRKVDWLLKIAADLDMHVALDTSAFLRPLLAQNKDPFDFTNYDEWDAMVDFMTQRVNTFTGVAYKDDPTIFQYMIVAETVPYGFTGDIQNLSRDVNIIEALYFHVADRLRMRDTKHLISAGGLLHMSAPKDQYNRDYWRTVWSHPNIDCAAIHIYLNDYSVFPSGSWSNLATYKAYADSIGKPLVVEEWGIDFYTNTLTVAENYFTNVYNLCHSLAIPVMITWDWSPSGGYSVFPRHTDSILAIMSSNAQRWGYTGTISSYTDPPIIPSGSVANFESSAEGFTSTGYGGNNGSPARTTARSTSGAASLRVPVAFTSTNWNFAGIRKYFSPLPNWQSGRMLVADVYVPAAATALQVKIIIDVDTPGGWVGYPQNSGFPNNWIDPGHWTTIYADLSPESIDWYSSGMSWNSIAALTFEIHHLYGTPVFSGDVTIDNIRLGSFDGTPVELSEFSLE